MGVEFLKRYCDNNFVQVQGDISDTKKDAEKGDPLSKNLEKSVFSSIPPARRFMGLPEKFENGDTATGLGLTALLVANLPEDFRDIKNSYRQIKSLITKTDYTKPYDYAKYQHDFSFFKGTLFHSIMKRVKSEKGKKDIKKMYTMDKSLYNSKIGLFFQDKLNIKNGDPVLSTIKDLHGDEMLVSEVLAPTTFARLTGRAMKRVTVLGAVTVGLLEVPNIIKSFKRGDDIIDKAESVGKQTVKSALNAASTIAGMAYGGAYGSMKGGATGSLIGMGFGAVLGSMCSDKLQKTITS